MAPISAQASAAIIAVISVLVVSSIAYFIWHYLVRKNHTKKQQEKRRQRLERDPQNFQDLDVEKDQDLDGEPLSVLSSGRSTPTITITDCSTPVDSAAVAAEMEEKADGERSSSNGGGSERQEEKRDGRKMPEMPERFKW